MTISSDAGLLVYRELDEALGLTADLEAVIDEPRMGKNIQHKLSLYYGNRFMVVWLDTKIPMMRNVSEWIHLFVK